MESLLKLLLERDRELERARTRALAMQQWAKVIELEAKREENALIRKQITKLVENSYVPKPEKEPEL
jgi:hypothetical protein